jgi:predicted NBD/HSP70 family sugar kinase
MTGPGIPVKLESGAAELLRLLREPGGATRAELMERTGWSRAIVAQHLEGLLRSRFVTSVGEAESTGGRPATRLAFDGSAAVVLAACVGETRAHVAIVDLAGRLVVTESMDHRVATGPLPTLESVAAQLNVLRERAGVDPGTIWGVGVGLPGPVDFASGRPINPPIMPGWDDFPVANWLRERFACVALVDNDANLMARGEHDRYWRDTDQLIYVKADTGMGAGLIVDGHLHRGAHGLAGDIGHIYVPGRDDAVCACGNLGCLEAVVGGHALAVRLTREGLATADARQVIEHVRAGDPRAVRAVRDAGRDLGHGLAGLVNAFNPGVLIIGGTLAGAGDHLLTGVREVVYRRSPPLATSALKIVRGSPEDDIGVIGAAATATDVALATIGVPDPATLKRAG